MPGRVVRATLEDLVTTSYPSDCRVCGRRPLAGLLPVSDYCCDHCDYRCDHCIDSVERQPIALCGPCAVALDIEFVRFAGQRPVEGRPCSTCRMARPEFERAVAYAVCEDELREMVHPLRYERMRTVAKPLSGFLAQADGSDWRSFGSANSS